MLTTLLYCFNAVAPVFVIIALGRLLAAKGGLPEEFFAKLNRLVYLFLIPAVLFEGVYEADLYSCFDGKLIVFLCSGAVILFLICSVIAARLYPDRAIAGSFLQGCCKSNYNLLAIPILGNLLGEAGMGSIMMAAPFLAFLYNLLGVLAFYRFGHGQNGKTGLRRVGQILWGVVKNPAILGVLLALPFPLLRIRLPLLLERSIGYIADMGTPVALVCIGAVLNLEKLRRCWKPALLSAVVKVVISTVAAVALAVALGFRGHALAIITVAFAAPTAANSHATAQELGGDGDTAASNVLLTTVLALITIVIFMTILLRNGLV